MRANTKKKHEMSKRFALLIGAAAVGVMALGAQTVMAGKDRTGLVPWHGGLGSEVTKCRDGREVILFEQRRGPDRELGSDRNKKLGENADPADPGWFSWLIWAKPGGRVYAKVMPKVGDGFVCRADRSRTIVNGRVGGSITTGQGGPITSTPSDPTAAEPPAVVKYDSKLTITRN